ncbi:MAG: Cys-Xaa-Xaa-Xaa repeat radical SAM target protein [Bacteroidales bacterium]|nr:Cys-Xaa-Xaa-Xaa repeat radical SAM target protein [Bacteroidales bacterium]
MENKEKNETQNRREFFKEASRKALPILGAVALMSNPVIAKALESEPMGCDGSCYGSCQGTCKGACSGGCKDGCRETCSTRCDGGCKGSCKRVSQY